MTKIPIDLHLETLPLDETDCFSRHFIDYIHHNKKLTPFYNTFPSIKNFQEGIKRRVFPDDFRKILSGTISSQYKGLEVSKSVFDNIKSLTKLNTFTVTTGHQLNIFTGPLYFIYKIVTVINACKALKKAYPHYHFVPIYWMASEDHDFEEISHFHFEEKTITWTTDQKGAVGRFDPSRLREMATELPKGAELFARAYTQNSLAKAVRCYVNTLFGEEGLIVVDADDLQLKKKLISVIEDDFFAHSTEKLVTEASVSLENLGYKPQIHARHINFFYLDQALRQGIQKKGERFEVEDSDLSFTESEIKKLIQTHPEKFSPNVALRPLYQELILPNLAYIGGPSEIMYWLQLKPVFDHFKVPFPILMPRNFALIISSPVAKKWKKTGLDHCDLFLSPEKAFTKWVKRHANQSVDYWDELQELEVLSQKLKKKACSVDPILTQHIEAIHTRYSRQIEKAGKKLLRAEKRKYSEKKAQIESVNATLFPRGSLQERKDNFLNFYLKDPQFIQKLLDTFDAFDYRMHLLFEKSKA